MKKEDYVRKERLLYHVLGSETLLPTIVAKMEE
jgi:hypothetical protein